MIGGVLPGRSELVRGWVLPATAFAVVLTGLYWLSVVTSSAVLYVAWMVLMTPVGGVIWLTLALAFGLAFTAADVSLSAPSWTDFVAMSVPLGIAAFVQGVLWRLALQALPEGCKRLRARQVSTH